MSWSATEIATLASKAARGGGAPPEQAARFGQVAAVHLMAGRDPVMLVAALDALPDGPILSHPLAIEKTLVNPEETLAPADDDLLHGYVETLPFEVELVTAPNGDWQLKVAPEVPRARTPPRRISGCAALVSKMTKLAENTLVPESESSRLSGAGAGLTDND